MSGVGDLLDYPASERLAVARDFAAHLSAPAGEQASPCPLPARGAVLFGPGAQPRSALAIPLPATGAGTDSITEAA
jgi:hypothetical protein